MEYKNIPISLLDLSHIRDIRESVISTLEERIGTSGYNPAKPLSVIENDGRYIVADGAHRLTVITKLGITDVPCVVYPVDADLYQLGVKCNQDEDTYAPMDLFDYLDVIKTLKSQGCTQEAIGEKIGWSESKVKQHGAIISDISYINLSEAKKHQFGRVTGEVTNVTFTEGWFREILKLNPENQKRMIDSYINSAGKLKGQSLQKQVSKYLLYEEMTRYVHQNIIDDSVDKEQLITDIYNGVYKTCQQLQKHIEHINEESQNKLIHGDSLIELHTIPDKSISLLITDPPYGIKYVSNRRVVDNDVTVPISNDDDTANELFESVLSIVARKLVDDAHLYVFCSWKNYSVFQDIIEQLFKIKNVIVWDKGNHGSGDLEGNYGDRYELIIFATTGNRKLNGTRDDNILQYKKVSDLEHPTQKPVDLLRYLIEKSTSPGEFVLDPFMGVGSVPVACVNRNPYVGIEMDDRYYKIAQRRIVGNGI